MATSFNAYFLMGRIDFPKNAQISKALILKLNPGYTYLNDIFILQKKLPFACIFPNMEHRFPKEFSDIQEDIILVFRNPILYKSAQIIHVYVSKL